MVAIDLTLIPYHGQPAQSEKEIYRSKPKSGTSHFHAYATAVAVHKGYRYTLALTRVEYGEAMKDIVQRLIRIVRDRGVKIRYLLLDKGFFSVSVMTYLKRAGHGFIIPVILRGRKSSDPKAAPNGDARGIQEEERLLPRTIESRDKNKRRNVDEGHDLRGQQRLREGKDEQEGPQKAPVRHLEDT